MRALVFDFDGVISDSARESYAIAVRTYVSLRPASPVAAEAPWAVAGQWPPAGGDPLFERFRALMPLGNRAEDYAVALEILAAGTAVHDQGDYDRFHAAQPTAFLASYHEHFYRERNRAMTADPATWRALQPPFAALLPVLHRSAARGRLAIATAKDGPSTAALLADYGLAGLFPAEVVLDKDAGTSKRAHLVELARRLACPTADMTFLDDKVNHLEDVAPLGVRCVLAGWGYNGAREWERAAACGFPVATLETVEALL